ncbi:MAG: hypothetical protein U0736_18530 [Gemmataceae bacterium]
MQSRMVGGDGAVVAIAAGSPAAEPRRASGVDALLARQAQGRPRAPATSRAAGGQGTGCSRPPLVLIRGDGRR